MSSYPGSARGSRGSLDELTAPPLDHFRAAQRPPVTYAAKSDHADNRTSLRTFSETKLGTKTTEFYLTLVAIIGILAATYMNDNDSLSTSRGWLYASIVIAAYVVSRGLAKLGSSEPRDS